MITERLEFKTGQLVIFIDEFDFQRKTYEITKIISGKLIQIDDEFNSRYTAQEFLKKSPIIIGEVKKLWGIFEIRIYY